MVRSWSGRFLGGVQGLWVHRTMLFGVKCDRIQPAVRDLADRVRRVVSADYHRHLHPAPLAGPQERRAEDPLREWVLYAVYDFTALCSAQPPELSYAHVPLLW